MAASNRDSHGATMTFPRRIRFLCLALLLAVPILSAQVKESEIVKQMDKLRSLSDAQRSAASIKLAQDIGTLPPGQTKLKYADALSHLVTEGDQGSNALQAVGDVLGANGRGHWPDTSDSAGSGRSCKRWRDARNGCIDQDGRRVRRCDSAEWPAGL